MNNINVKLLTTNSFYELIDKKDIERLLNPNCSILKDIWDDKPNISKAEKAQGLQNDKEQFRNYLKRHHGKKGFEVRYKLPLFGKGRVFPVGGLGAACFGRKIRNFLMDKLYIDLDMCNAHPNLLLNYCRNNHISCVQMENYCFNRANILEECAAHYQKDVKVMKDLFIRLCFFGTHEEWMVKHDIHCVVNGERERIATLPFVAAFENELRSIGEEMKKLDLANYNAVATYKTKEGETHNITGSFVSLFLQNEECCLVSTIIKEAYNAQLLKHPDFKWKKTGDNIMVCSYEYDGFKLLRENVDWFESKCNITLTEWVNNLTKQITHVDIMKWDIKAMTSEIQWPEAVVLDVDEDDDDDEGKEIVVDLSPDESTFLSQLNDSGFCVEGVSFDFIVKEMLQVFEACGRDFTKFPFYFRRAIGKGIPTRAQLMQKHGKKASSVYLFKSKEIESDTWSAQRLFSLYPYWQNYKNALYVYDDTTGRWDCNESKKRQIIAGFEMFFKSSAKKPNLCTSDKGQHVLLSQLVILEEVNNVVDHLSLLHLQDSSLKLLLFRNGYYDGKVDKFIRAPLINDKELFLPKKKGFIFTNPEIVFSDIVRDPYLENLTEVEKTQMAFIKQVMFYDMHGKEVGDVILENMACALMGECLKKIVFNFGSSNSGKSVFMRCFSNALGTYVDPLATKKFECKKGSDNRESGRINDFVGSKWHKRILYMQEDAGLLLNTEMLKAHSSGGFDEIQSRFHYKEDESYIIQYMLFFFLNYKPEFSNQTDAAFIARCMCVSWNKSFKDVVENESCQLLKRPEVEHWHKDKTFRQLFVLLFLDAYAKKNMRGEYLPIPESIAMKTQENFGVVRTSEEMIIEMYQYVEFTGNVQNDFIPNSELEDIAITCCECKSKEEILRAFENFISCYNLGEYIKKDRKKHFDKKTMRSSRPHGLKGLKKREESDPPNSDIVALLESKNKLEQGQGIAHLIDAIKAIQFL